MNFVSSYSAVIASERGKTMLNYRRLVTSKLLLLALYVAMRKIPVRCHENLHLLITHVKHLMWSILPARRCAEAGHSSDVSGRSHRRHLT